MESPAVVHGGVAASRSWVSWSLLTLGVVAASVSAILTRYASADGLGDAQPLAIAFWRCFAGAAVLVPFAWTRLRKTGVRELALPALSGAFLAVHFAAWLTSLDLTSIAASVLLVSTTPVFVALAAWVLLRERLAAIGWAGIALALAGTALIGGDDLEGSSLVGNALALLGGVTSGGYVLAGQVARQRLGVLEYAVLAYGVAAAALLAACGAADVPLAGYGRATWIAIAAIVAGPQLLGHTVINLVLKDIDATMVSVSIMVEPVIAIALAFLIFEEVPSALVYPGGAAIVVGIVLVTRVRRSVPVVE